MFNYYRSKYLCLTDTSLNNINLNTNVNLLNDNSNFNIVMLVMKFIEVKYNYYNYY